jgi:hypothetical protein
MPVTTILDMPASEQEQMLATLRRVRYGYSLALTVFMLCAAGHHPTEIAAFLLCSRSFQGHRSTGLGDLQVKVGETFGLSLIHTN